MKKMKIVDAGPYRLAVLYTYPPRNYRGADRAMRQQPTTIAQDRVNKMTSYLKLEGLLACNFTQGDMVCTLTYDDEHLPPSRDAARKDFRRFCRKLRTVRAKENAVFYYVYVIEDKHGDARLHFHAVINATSSDYSAVRMAWGYGHVDIEPLVPFGKIRNYTSLAKYMTKEPREFGQPKRGERCWAASRNMLRPETDTMDVEDYIDLTAPPGTFVLEDDGNQTEFGQWHSLKTYDPTKQRPAFTVPKGRSQIPPSH